MSNLNAGSRKILLGLARAAIRQALVCDGSLDIALERTPIPEELTAPRGAFVSLKGSDDSLRGCVGNVTGAEPLYRTVIEIAPRSALEDPRFPALTAGDLDRVRIEISALTAIRPLGSIDGLVPGRHGVQLQLGDARAVFLPQVAAEREWNAEQLLTQLARKAGLAPERWKEADLGVFDAEVFGEG